MLNETGEQLRSREGDRLAVLGAEGDTAIVRVVTIAASFALAQSGRREGSGSPRTRSTRRTRASLDARVLSRARRRAACEAPLPRSGFVQGKVMAQKQGRRTKRTDLEIRNGAPDGGEISGRPGGPCYLGGRVTTFLPIGAAPARISCVAVLGLLLGACGGGRAAGPPPAVPAGARFRLRLCSEAPIRLEGPPGAPQSRGCVVTFAQELSDPATIRSLGTNKVARRYLVYAPASLRANPRPSCSFFPATQPAPNRSLSTPPKPASRVSPIETDSSSCTATGYRTGPTASTRRCLRPRAVFSRAAWRITPARGSTCSTSAKSSRSCRRS